MLKSQNVSNTLIKRAFVSIFLRLALLVKQLLAAVILSTMLMLKVNIFKRTLY